MIIFQRGDIVGEEQGLIGCYVNLRPWGAGGNAPSNPSWRGLTTPKQSFSEKSPCALAQGAFFPSSARVSGFMGQEGPCQRPGVFRASGDDLSVRTNFRRCAALSCASHPIGPRPVLYFQDFTKNIRGTFSWDTYKIPPAGMPPKKGRTGLSPGLSPPLSGPALLAKTAPGTALR